VLFIGIRRYQHAQLSPDRIYNEAFVDFNVATTRGTEHLSNIESLYQQKQYSRVTLTVRTLNLSAKDSLLIGLAYLHQKNLPTAITWFNPLTVSASGYHQDAEFYLSLSYLKLGNYVRAASLVERIYRNPEHLYHQQLSEEIVDKVRRLAQKN
jgi:tetratricopeptide (TPR) repeat protein